MADRTPDTSSYTMGYNEEFLQLLHRRSAETYAVHLMPHLKPGLRVLDFGCGPGTISVGLARAVEPGEVHGIDMEESQIGLARAAAAAGGHGNATFHVGDVTELPFEDNSFDAAHCHAVLMHVPDTRAVLSEVMRVLKPGGVIASREMIVASSFFQPDLGNFDAAWATFTKVIQMSNDGYRANLSWVQSVVTSLVLPSSGPVSPMTEPPSASAFPSGSITSSPTASSASFRRLRAAFSFRSWWAPQAEQSQSGSR